MKRILIALVISALILAVILMCFYTPSPSDTELRDVCAANLKVLGQAIAAYRQDNKGMFPLAGDKPATTCSLLLLYPSYISSSILKCPADKEHQSVRCQGNEYDSVIISYQYRPPLTTGEEKNLIVVYDRYPRIHSDGASIFKRQYGRNVLSGDGRVIWLEEQSFLEIMSGEDRDANHDSENDETR